MAYGNTASFAPGKGRKGRGGPRHHEHWPPPPGVGLLGDFDDPFGQGQGMKKGHKGKGKGKGRKKGPSADHFPSDWSGNPSNPNLLPAAGMGGGKGGAPGEGGAGTLGGKGGDHHAGGGAGGEAWPKYNPQMLKRMRELGGEADEPPAKVLKLPEPAPPVVEGPNKTGGGAAGGNETSTFPIGTRVAA